MFLQGEYGLSTLIDYRGFQVDREEGRSSDSQCNKDEVLDKFTVSLGKRPCSELGTRMPQNEVLDKLTVSLGNRPCSELGILGTGMH